MPTTQEISQRLKKEYNNLLKEPKSENSQEKLNKIFYESLLSILDKLDRPKGQTNFVKKPFTDGKVPRKRNPYTP